MHTRPPRLPVGDCFEAHKVMVFVKQQRQARLVRRHFLQTVSALFSGHASLKAWLLTQAQQKQWLTRQRLLGSAGPKALEAALDRETAS